VLASSSVPPCRLANRLNVTWYGQAKHSACAPQEKALPEGRTGRREDSWGLPSPENGL
jgi:hypothetical protein